MGSRLVCFYYVNQLDYDKCGHVLNFDLLPRKEQQINFFNAYLDAREAFTRQRIKSPLASPQLFSTEQLHEVFKKKSPKFSPSVSPKIEPSHTGKEMSSEQLEAYKKSPLFSPTLSPMLTPQILMSFRKKEIESLLEETQFFIPCSHMFWGLWGIIQASQSQIDFDFLSYAEQRLLEYHKTKELAL
jgi:hypothetical protein